MGLLTRSTDPAREVALLALEGSPYQPAQALEAVFRYAFEQLGFHRTDDQLLALVDELRDGLLWDSSAEATR